MRPEMYGPRRDVEGLTLFELHILGSKFEQEHHVLVLFWGILTFAGTPTCSASIAKLVAAAAPADASFN